MNVRDADDFKSGGAVRPSRDLMTEGEGGSICKSKLAYIKFYTRFLHVGILYGFAAFAVL